MKKKQYLPKIMAIALALVLVMVLSGCALLGGLFGGGDKGGKEVDEGDISWYDAKQSEFTLTTKEQMEGFSWLTRREKKTENFDGKTINLGGDIDLGGSNWKPTGSFCGVFDGKGYTLSNLTVSGGEEAGLFSKLENAKVKNLVVKVQKIETKKGGSAFAGGLSGFGVLVSIENCGVIIEDSITAYAEKASGSSTPTAYAGGLVGWIDGPMTTSSITKSYVTGNVAAVSGVGGGSVAGGLVGNIGMTLIITLNITDCYMSGTVTSTVVDSNAFAGGILGAGALFTVNVKNTYANASLVTSVADPRGGRNEPFFGGIFGRWGAGTGNSGTNSSVYYNSTKVTSEKISSGARGGALPEGIKGLSDADMKRQASFAGFDFNGTWAVEANTNGGYPYLRWQK